MSEKYLCRCIVCGTLVPPENFNQSYKFEVIKKVQGGKIARTEAQKMTLTLAGGKTGRGSAPGRVQFIPAGDTARDIYLPAIDNAARRAIAILRAEAERH